MQTDLGMTSRGWLTEALNGFLGLSAENREAFLQYLAISIYRAEGTNSLDPISLLIFQTEQTSRAFWPLPAR